MFPNPLPIALCGPITLCQPDRPTWGVWQMPGTVRLLLREWRPSDWSPFATLNADPRVMEQFPSVLTKVESDAAAGRIQDHHEQHGFGLWVVEVRGVEPFIGVVGLQIPSFDAHFTPCVEVGWRLAFEHWNQGYATEAAQAAIAFGFSHLALTEIVALTAMTNVRSQRVMQRIGMSHDPADDFDHPRPAPGHRLERHVLYRLGNPDEIP